MPKHVQVRAPGKVNLQLTVGPVDAAGYHELVTVFQAVDRYETVTLRPRLDGQISISTAVTAWTQATASDIPHDDRNLAWQALELMRERYGITAGADIMVEKDIPVAGGMAGGSADAAATLVAANQLWECGASKPELIELARRLGADVPFALHGMNAIGCGRGDELAPVLSRAPFHWVFATQATGLNTAEVFRTYDQLTWEVPRLEPHAELLRALNSGDPERLGPLLHNDLTAAALALRPQLADVFEVARQAQALGTVLSGAGPTVAALARSEQHAAVLVTELVESGTAHTVVAARGPAPGATVVSS